MAAAVCGKPPTFAVAFGGQLVLRQRGFPVELSGFTARVTNTGGGFGDLLGTAAAPTRGRAGEKTSNRWQPAPIPEALRSPNSAAPRQRNATHASTRANPWWHPHHGTWSAHISVG
ncbi:unnamed protein product [Lampetra planeri]